jgi:hypothetical protein
VTNDIIAYSFQQYQRVRHTQDTKGPYHLINFKAFQSEVYSLAMVFADNVLSCAIPREVQQSLCDRKNSLITESVLTYIRE